MIVLDENVYEEQRALLRRWHIHLCQIGLDAGRKGMNDDEIIPLLRTIRRPTFFSRDSDFHDKRLCSDQFCLVHLDVPALEVADYVRRLLRHPEFRTWSQRQGRVTRVAASGISSWRIRLSQLTRHRWVDRR
jgi:hypothetical protein